MSSIPANPEMIRWALDRSSLTTRKLGKVFPRIEDWTRGDVHPTLKQLEKLAKRTYTPLGYFFLSIPPDETLPIPDFRTVQNQPVRRPSPDLLDSIQIMQRRQTWMREFLHEEGALPLSFIESVKTTDTPEFVAGKMRRTLGITNSWASQHRTWSDALRALREAAETAGILVVINGVVGNNTHRKLQREEFEGFVLCDDFAPLIFINGADWKSAQMFTLAHELAHLWLGTGGVFNLPRLQPADNEIEIFCNRVAAEFLVPADEVRTAWPRAKNETEPFQALARRFKVSAIVAARRTLDLKLISRAMFFDFWGKYQQDERRRMARSSGGDFYATQDTRIGKRFATTVMLAAKAGRLLYRDAYELTGLTGKTFDSYAKHLGIRLS